MDQKVLRKELQKLVADSPDETYYDTSIHNKTNVNKFNNLDIVQLKQTFQDEFYKQFINYNHSKIIGLENFQYIDSIIGVTQYIDNLFIMYRDIYALPLEYRYSFLLNGKTRQNLVSAQRTIASYALQLIDVETQVDEVVEIFMRQN